MGRPVLLKEAMDINMDIIVDNELNTYNILRIIYKMTDDIIDNKLKGDIQLKLREAAVFEQRITKKLNNFHNIYVEDMYVTDEEALNWGNDNAAGGMEFISPTQYTYCEALRDVYRMVKNITDEDLKRRFKLIIRKATVHGTRLAGKLDIGKTKENNNADFGLGIFWVKK